MRRNLAVYVLLPVVLGACTSGYQQFYKPAQGMDPAVVAARRVGPAPAMPIVERSQPVSDGQQVLAVYSKRGYVMIGNSFFNTGHAESEQAAISQAQTVGADLVLIFNPRYTGSVTSNVPITTPTSSTSYSTGTATAYGAGGPITAYGSGTTTTYGTQTTYVPMTVHRSDYGAVYFVKQRFSLGVFTRELTDSERQALQSNKGAAVRLVVDNSPAYDADILPGDIITALDGVTVTTPQNFISMLSQRGGREVTLSIYRNGRVTEKVVKLN